MRNISILLIFLLASAFVFADDLAIYKEANRLYGEGKYEKALSLYKKLVSEGVRDSSVYYNLGNTYFRLNNVARSILNYERAKLLSPKDEDIKANLNYVTQLIKDRPEEQEVNPLFKFFFFYYYIFSLHELSVIFLVCFTVAILSVILYVLFNIESLRKTLFVLFWVSVFFLALFLTTTIVKYQNVYKSGYAIILEDVLPAYSGTGENYEVLFSVHAGSKVLVREVRKGYAKILLDNGMNGWVKKDGLEKI